MTQLLTKVSKDQLDDFQKKLLKEDALVNNVLAKIDRKLIIKCKIKCSLISP